MKIEKLKEESNFLIKLLISLGIIAILGAIAFPILTLTFSTSFSVDKIKDLGAYGDFFGGTTVGLFSLASSMFLIATILLQRKSISVQQEEMSNTNEQLRLQKVEFSITNETMKKQAFDSIFFQMINLQNNITKEICIKEDRYGKDAWIALFNEFNGFIKSKENEIIIEKFKIDIELLIKEYGLKRVEEKLISLILLKGVHYKNSNLKEIELETIRGYLEDVTNKNIERETNYSLIRNGFLNVNTIHSYLKTVLNDLKGNYERKVEYEKLHMIEVYEEFYDSRMDIIGHYYRNLYTIFEMIDRLELTDKTEINIQYRKNYINILRAQLSSKEFILIYYNINYSSKGNAYEEILLRYDFFLDLVNEMKEEIIWDMELKELAKHGLEV